MALITVAALTAAGGLYFLRQPPADPALQERRIFAPPSSWLATTTLVAEASSISPL